jgi:hypothetical protein
MSEEIKVCKKHGALSENQIAKENRRKGWVCKICKDASRLKDWGDIKEIKCILCQTILPVESYTKDELKSRSPRCKNCRKVYRQQYRLGVRGDESIYRKIQTNKKLIPKVCKIDGCISTPYRGLLCSMHINMKARNNAEKIPKKIIQILPDGIVKICKKHGNLTDKDVWTKKKCCRYCHRKSQKKYDLLNKSKFYEIRKIYNHQRKLKKYKMSDEDYNSILLNQDGKCKICKKRENIIDNKGKNIKKLAVDHCHKTNKVRGLLCGRCNTAIGLLHESTSNLQACIEYLNRAV